MTDYYAPQEDYELLEAQVLDEDIDQEVELLRLLGVAHPNKRLVALKLQAQQNELLFSDLSQEGSVSLIGTEPEPSPRAITELLHLARAQPLLASAIYAFLEDPEEKFEETLKVLKHFGFIKSLTQVRKQQKQSGGSVAQMILRLLEAEGVQSKDQIMEAVAPHHMAKRPAAAIRTSLRRLLETNKIRKIGGDSYALNSKV